MKRLSLFIVGWSYLIIILSSAQSPQQPVIKIVTNRSVFGKDFPTALASLPGWASQDERQVTVFSHQIVGATAFDTKAEAEKRVTQLNKRLRNLRPRFKPELGALARARVPRLRAQVVPFSEDDSIRLALSNPGWELINPQLTPARLQEALGPPQKISYVTVQNKTERIPIQLKVYEYADGQIFFAESSPATRPGFIDRATLDVRAVNAAVFQEVK